MMQRKYYRFVIPAVFILVASIARAAPRTWTSQDGRFTTKAELVDYEDGKAALKKTDGNVIHVLLLSLCEEDREFVKRQFPGVKEEEFRPGVEYRQWKNKTGKFSTLAEFLGVSEGKVWLRKLDGSEIAVDQKLLSEADQHWVTEELERQPKEDGDKDSTEAVAGFTGDGRIRTQEIAMRLMRLEFPKRKEATRGKPRGQTGGMSEYVFRRITPQRFIRDDRAASKNEQNPTESRFRKIVTKEPRYGAPTPFRDVASLGSKQYAFALDKASETSKGFDRL
jgi:hypothetical protein